MPGARQAGGLLAAAADRLTPAWAARTAGVGGPLRVVRPLHAPRVLEVLCFVR